ncbi:MAG: carboxypeptidase regulatory-like domain-containing protein [Candidatus Hydrogenedentota bacterium]|nr:MAG: carboxypeptidase regulatory-like domain-containing protein [Candidatus Hydrogenedentota bacterium]
MLSFKKHDFGPYHSTVSIIIIKITMFFLRRAFFYFIPIGVILFLGQCKQDSLATWENGTAVYRKNSGTGKANGRVLNAVTNSPLENVQVISLVRGEKVKILTDKQGTFQLELLGIKRGEGYNIHFQKEGFLSITRAGIFRLPNLRLELGEIKMIPLNDGDHLP